MTEHTLSLTALAESLRHGEHSIFSASGSHTWSVCAGSLIPGLLAPDDSGYDAAEGTVAHGVGETWLRTGKKPRHLIGSTQVVKKKDSDQSFTVEITAKMLDFVQRYVDWCWQLPGDHYVETRVDFSDIMPIPYQGGTADHAACSWELLIITDLKFGKGEMIYAENNPQLMLYAYGFFRDWDWLYNFQEIVIRVAQPRLDHMDVWTCTREQLLAFAEDMRPKATAAWRLDAPRTPGDKQCRFCRVKVTCAAHVKYQADLMDGFYHALSQPVTNGEMEAVKERLAWMEKFRMHNVAELSLSDLSTLYQWRTFVERWWKALGVELKRRVAMGERPPLQKLVRGRSIRFYPNERRAIEYFTEDLEIPREEIVSERVLSPNKMEEVLRKHGHRRKDLADLLDQVVEKPPGKPALVSIYDKRDAIEELDDGIYQDLTNPETQDSEPEDY